MPTNLDWRIATYLYKKSEKIKVGLCPKCEERMKRVPRECGICGAPWSYDNQYRKRIETTTDIDSIDTSSGRVTIRDLFKPGKRTDYDEKRDRFFGLLRRVDE